MTELRGTRSVTYLFDVFTTSIADALLKVGAVDLPGLGKLKVVRIQRGGFVWVVNPRTNVCKKKVIKPIFNVEFTPCKSFEADAQKKMTTDFKDRQRAQGWVVDEPRRA